MKLRWIVVVLLVATGCKPKEKEKAAPPIDKTDKPVPAKVDTEALEAAYQKTVEEHPEGLPECGPDVTGPCTMKTTSGIGHLEGGKWTSGDKLPPALHGHGEALRGAWVAPDGTEFLTGYMYTGVPGPDTGVVYRKDGDAWTIVYSKPENELGHIWGSSSSDVWVAGVTTLAHWDGTAWKEEPIPMLAGTLTGIWGDGTVLYVVGGDWQSEVKTGAIYRRDGSGTWTLDDQGTAMLYGVGGLGDTVVAVGDDGTILHREKGGEWKREGKTDEQHTEVFVAGPKDLYVAGSRLLHSSGDGTWEPVELPTDAQATSVWGRSATDLYVGTLSGLFHWDGTAWKATPWDRSSEAIAGNDKKLLVANQDM
jgi:hypothetical protein